MPNDRLTKALATAQRIAREEDERKSRFIALVSKVFNEMTEHLATCDSDLADAYSRGLAEGRKAERVRLTAELAELVRAAEMIASSAEQQQAIRQVFAPLLGEEHNDD